MKYHAPTKQLTADIGKFELAASSFLYAIRHIRKLAGLPLTRYKQGGPLQGPDFAMKGIIDGARALGIDLGAEWGCEIDVSEPEIKQD
jgi:hypothetical protein